MTAVRRDDRVLVLRSRQALAGSATLALDSLVPGTVTGWAVPGGRRLGVRDAGYQVPGATIEINSDLPVGAGLSSSAGLECATALALTGLAGLASRAPLSSKSPAALRTFHRRAVRDHGPVRVPAVRGRACAAPGLQDAGGVPGAVRPRRGRALAARDQHSRRARARQRGYARRRAECEEAARQLAVPSLGCLTDATIRPARRSRPASPGPAHHQRQCPGSGGGGAAPLRIRRPGRLPQDRSLAVRGSPVAAQRLQDLLAQADVTVDAAVAAGRSAPG